jgi:hypothetical protein
VRKPSLLIFSPKNATFLLPEKINEIKLKTIKNVGMYKIDLGNSVNLFLYATNKYPVSQEAVIIKIQAFGALNGS